MNKIILIVSLLVFCALSAQAKEYLHRWNSAGDSGQTWSGWTYQADARYGHPGWARNNHTENAGDEYPEMFEKGTEGSNLATIDATKRAPSTSAGASFKFYDDGTSGAHNSQWWIYYGLNQLSVDPGVTNSTTNRMDFYMYREGINVFPEDGGYNSIPQSSIQIGTYLCWTGGEAGGENCPTESSGQHWYQYLTVQPGAWIHVSLDQHPTHKRGACNGSDNTGCVVGNNPSNTEWGKNFYENMHQMYFEDSWGNTSLTSFWVDEIGFDYAPNENEQSITSVWVGYYSGDDYWRIGFQDVSWMTSSGPGVGDDKLSTFEIRYSSSPITNATWDVATKVSAELYAGTAYTGSTDTSMIRRTEGSKYQVYTKFKLSDDFEAANDSIYFAIKDVSVVGSHTGASYPWNYDDGHDAPSSNVRTIDYALRTTFGGSLTNTNVTLKAGNTHATRKASNTAATIQ